MMRIGILTFHCAHNYGAILQCYALQEYLKSIGHEVSVIDYRPDYIVQRYAAFSRRYWKSNGVLKTTVRLLTEPFLFCIRVMRHHKMEASIKEMLHLCPYPVENNLFDAVILGSDQIWNPMITGEQFDEVYFGKDFRCKKIVYAASNRSISLTDEEKAFYQHQLPQLDWISVRESTFQSLLSPLTDKTIYQSLDPTLLSDLWLKNLHLRRPKAECYVMFYEAGQHIKNKELAMTYAIHMQIHFVELIDTLALSRKKINHVALFASPMEFLAYIKYSTIVFTSSFHGVALSILFQKDFYYIRQHSSVDYRIESLLDLLGMNDRIIERDTTPADVSIDYTLVKDKLRELRNSSTQYIDKALVCVA